MMMDAPRYVKKNPNETTPLTAEQEEEQMYNYYQSQLEP